jgi:MarR family transcriptional regulator, organic hydroperoxide resistance regulator
VAQHARLSLGQLANLLHLDPSTVTGIVKRLQKRGMVRRLADPADGRRVRIGLTDRGRRLSGSDPRTVEALVEKALSVFPRAKVDATAEVLRTLTNVLERETER